MDVSYAIIQLFDGKPFILYMEPIIRYHVEDIKETNNHIFDIWRELMDGYPSKNSRTSIEDQYENLYILPFSFEEMIFPEERKDKHDEPLILEIALE